MKHSNIINFLSGSMWLSTDDQMAVISRVANSIIEGSNPELRKEFMESKAAAQGDDISELDMGNVTVENGIATVPLTGAIAPKLNAMSAFSGGTSAEMFGRNVQRVAAMDDVHTILLHVDSNGGSVHGIEAAANAVREARETKRVIAFAEYNMNSAAYWIASAADQILLTPTSNIGSIGVIAQLNFASAEDQERVQIIRSVPGKAAVNPFEPLSEESRTKLQTDIDRIHQTFTEAVSLNRRISMPEATKLANGEVEMGEAAVEAGLADQVVGSLDEVLAQINAVESADTRIAALTEAYKASDADHKSVLAEMALVDADLQAAYATISTLQAQLADLATAEISAKFESAVDAAIDSGRIAAGLRTEFLTDLQEGNVSFDAFSRMVGNISAGTVVPQEELSPQKAANDSDPLAPSNELEEKLFAQFPSLRR